MADFFFGFATSLANSSLEDGLDYPLDDDIGEEEEYDALNDETFGSEATIGDWEKDHEKLAEITESSRPHHQNAIEKKNGVHADIEDNLSHLVLDEKEGIVPRPGVWDSPSTLSAPKPRPPLTLPSTLTNVCTVEELEKGLIANKPPPGLNKPVQTQQQQQQQKSDGSLLFDSISAPPRFPPGLGIPPPHPVSLPPNMRFPPPQFVHPRLLPNQTGNVLRYPVGAHLMLPHAAQRQPIHGSFCNTFPQPPPHSNLGHPPFLRPDHGMMPPFSSNQSNQQQQQHSFPHSAGQRNQNRSFHHGEQQGNHQPFFKNNQHHRNYDRNNQRQYYYHHHCQGINGVTNSGEYDEYADLMSNREKQWLINIQLLQLNTNEPYVDDYYYTVFCDKKNKRNTNQDQKDKKQNSNDNNNGFYRDNRDREQQPHHVLTRPVYTPMQFENSLGKLQFASVIAPRKIIDMDVVPNSDPQLTTQIQQKDTKRTRQLLLEIERLYIIQLKIEDLHNPLALLNDQQNQEGQNNSNSDKKTTPELVNAMLLSFLQHIQDDKLASMLSIRKGKTLLLRFLPYVSETEYRIQLEELWNAIFRGLAVIGRRDSDLLISLHTEFQRWFNAVQNFGTILRLARSLSDSVSQPIKINSLAFALTNKFGVSVIASMLEQAENLYPTDDSLSTEWSSFIANIIETIGESPPCVAPCQPIAANTLDQHLNRLSHLKSGRYTNLELLLTDANPSR
ncbi:protein associated with topo II related - 1 isoform X1 [Megachile rotundata]|uniref:protein associated with topo II related - 1 isoform X1 n=1 Tax=Megachile rotundata TaxID=143995 RepID=UPI000258F87C|nr:PREDICTED: protein PAT1 homolog 1 isoform X1 [Megachile rotundata]